MYGFVWYHYDEYGRAVVVLTNFTKFAAESVDYGKYVRFDFPIS